MTEEPAVLKQQSAADLADVVVPEADGAFQLAPEDAPAALEALLYAAGDPRPFRNPRRTQGLTSPWLGRFRLARPAGWPATVSAG